MIVDFPQKKNKHLSGNARCLECKHEWLAVSPVGVSQLECPNCHTEKGVFNYPVCPNEYWVCNCGGDLFFVTKEGYYCYKCGVEISG